MKIKYLLGVALLSSSMSTQIFANSSVLNTISFVQTCSTDNPLHILVNKQNALPSNYIPESLTVPDVPFSFSGFHEKRQLTEDAATALEKLFNHAQSESMELVAISGYRSYNRQEAIYNSNVAKDGQAIADTYSARPGTSEHQTGLAIDVSSASVNYHLTEQFGDTPEGIWLATHAHEHGFIIRYPEGKQPITGYIYEPWHIRYVGVELATQLYKSGLTLEEINHCCSSTPNLPLVQAPYFSSDSKLLSYLSESLILFDLYNRSKTPYFLTHHFMN